MSSMGGMALSLPDENKARLDKASIELGKTNKTLSDIKKQISELSSDIAMAMPETSQLSDDLAQLADSYRNVIADQFAVRQRIVEQKLDVDECEEVVKMLYNNEMLEVGFEIGDDKKPRYKNDVSRNAATKTNLASNDEYNAAKAALKAAKLAVGKTSAEIDMNDELLKEYGRRNAALISRLDFATAQLNALGGA